LQVLATNSFGLPRIKHKLLTTLVRDNERDWYDQLINWLSNSEALFPG
jgi:hypothetical protein